MIPSTKFIGDDERMRTYQKPDIWVVYAMPADYPDRYVARRWERGGARPVDRAYWNSYVDLVATTDRLIALNLAELRKLIPADRGCFPPPHGADPVIAEVWI